MALADGAGEEVVLGLFRVHYVFELGDEFSGKDGEAVFTALASPYEESKVLEVDIADAEPGDFGDAEAGGVQEGDDEFVFGVMDGLDDSEDILAVEDFRELFIHSRIFDVDHEFFASEQVVIEELEGAGDLGDA